MSAWGMATLTVRDILDAGLDDWRQLAQGLHARYRTKNFVKGLEFVTAVTEAAEEADHHPDVTLTYTHVDLALISHDVGRITGRDLKLARRITEIAAEMGIEARPHAVAQFELALDTADLAGVSPFWSVLLTGKSDALSGDEIVDKGGRVPTMWFQNTDAHETPRQRFHVDLWLPHDIADERIAAALDAGGRLVSDDPAPSFTVLADAEGNQVCVCTCLER